MSYLSSYLSPKTEVRETSRIQGKGLFAKELIKKGEIVAIKGGHVFNSKEYCSLDDAPKQYCLQIDDDFFIGPKTKEEIHDNALFTNHSCEPNFGFDGQIVFVAMRDIRAGEELVQDYAMCFTKRKYEFKCYCGAKKCRGTITDNDWKLKDLQKKYGKHLAYFILKKIEK